MRDTKQKGIDIRTHHASELAALTRSHIISNTINNDLVEAVKKTLSEGSWQRRLSPTRQC